MTDLVQRLRRAGYMPMREFGYDEGGREQSDLMMDAAAEIEKLQADVATAKSAYERSLADCRNLTEKVIPNIRQDLKTAEKARDLWFARGRSAEMKVEFYVKDRASFEGHARAAIKSVEKRAAHAESSGAASKFELARLEKYIAKHAPMTLQAYEADRTIRTDALDRLAEWIAENGVEY